jgi:hypothetical protein
MTDVRPDAAYFERLLGDAMLDALCNSPIWENRHIGELEVQIADDLASVLADAVKPLVATEPTERQVEVAAEAIGNALHGIPFREASEQSREAARQVLARAALRAALAQGGSGPNITDGRQEGHSAAANITPSNFAQGGSE